MTAWQKIKGATYYTFETPYHLFKKAYNFCFNKPAYQENKAFMFKGWLKYFQWQSDREIYENELTTIIKYKAYLNTNNMQVQFMPTIRHQHLYQIAANKTLLEIYTRFYEDLLQKETVLEKIHFNFFVNEKESLLQEYKSKLIEISTMHIEQLQVIIREAEEASAIREKELDVVVDSKMEKKEEGMRRHTDAQLKIEETKIQAMNETHLNELTHNKEQHQEQMQILMTEHAKLKKQLELIQLENTTLQQSNAVLANNNQLLGETNSTLTTQCALQSNTISEWENKAKTSNITYNDVLTKLQDAQNSNKKLHDITKKYEVLHEEYKSSQMLVEGYKQKLQEKDNDIALQKRELEHVEKEVNLHKNYVTTLENKSRKESLQSLKNLKEQQTLIDELNDKLAAAKDQVQTLRSDLTFNKKFIEALTVAY